MNRLCKFGLFILTVQNGGCFSFQQTSQSQNSMEDYQAKNIFTHAYEFVSNGVYLAFTVIVVIYFLFLVSTKQVDNYLSGSKDAFKRLELSQRISDPSLYVDYGNSNETFCTADLDGATGSSSLIQSFGLISEDEPRRLRRPLRDFWVLSKEPSSRQSAVEILRREIQESRKLRHELENNLEKILQENNDLINDKMDWSNQLQLEDFKMADPSRFQTDRAKLRERVTVLENGERLTRTSLRDHTAIQQRLAESRTEIKKLQQQIQDLKLEKQASIELINKILFPNNYRDRLQTKGLVTQGTLRNSEGPVDVFPEVDEEICRTRSGGLCSRKSSPSSIEKLIERLERNKDATEGSCSDLNRSEAYGFDEYFDEKVHGRNTLSKSTRDSSTSIPLLTATSPCRELEKEMNQDENERKSLLEQIEQTQNHDSSLGPPGEVQRCTVIGGPVTSSPQFKQFYNNLCKEAKMH